MFGYTVKEGRKLQLHCGLFVHVLASILAGGFSLYLLLGTVLDSQILDQIVISNQAKATAQNSIQDTDSSYLVTTYYVYNLTNPDEVVTGSGPVFESVGPYVYWTFVGKANGTYNDDIDTFAFYLRYNMIFQPSLSASHDAEITTVDFGYANAFGKSTPINELTLEYMMSIGFAAAIQGALAEAMVLDHYAAAIAGASSQSDFLASQMATMSANYGETIDSMMDMAYAQWGGGAMIDDGNDVNGTDKAADFIDSATWRSTIAAVLTTTTYLDTDQKATITASFKADTDYAGVGIYQFAQLLSPGVGCPRLSINKTKSIIDCYTDVENCGLVAISTLQLDVAAGLALFGLNSTDESDLCYSTALMSYPAKIAPLAKHFWKDRLLLEKGVNNLLFTKKKASQILEGYNSSLLYSLAQPPAIPSFVYKHTTEEIAIAESTKMETDGGATNIYNYNKLISVDNVTGYDYNSNGTITPIGDCYGGFVYPPNQKGGSWEPYKESYEVYDTSFYKACTMKKDATETFSLDKFSTPVFYRDDVSCFGTDAERATTNGYINVKHALGAMAFMTPACMYKYTDQKLWTDDCNASKAEHSSYTAIDSISGGPWKLQKNMQVVLGLDGTTSFGTNAYNINTQINTTNRFPVFRMKMFMELRGKDRDTLVSAYSLLFLLKDTLSFVFTGIGGALFIPAYILIFTAVKKIKGAAVKPIDNTGTEMKEAA